MRRQSLNVLNFFILLSMSLGLIGCVGTVENAKKPTTKITSDTKADLIFAGISVATPISHDKIEVFFFPATGGTGKYDYVIQVGENPIPVSVPSEILLPDYRGYLKYTITNLERGKKYYLKMEAYDQDGKAKSSNINSKTVTTFTNIVADFRGISSVSNSPGADGLDSIRVRWSHAKMRYDNFGTPYEGNPWYYEVIVVDSTRHGPAALDDRSINSSNGRWVKIVTFDPMFNETTVNGLPSNTKFFVRVRAIHEGTLDDVSNIRMRGELNSDYLSISTLSADLSGVAFKNFVTMKNSGIFQTSSLLLTWSPILGVFEHLRLYWVDEIGKNLLENTSALLDPSTSGFCGIAPTQSSPSCKKMLSTLTGTLVANLNPSTNYYFRLVACQNSECTNYAISEVVTGNTFPSLAGFGGLKIVNAADSIYEIGTFTLLYELPDLSLGYFDGFVIGYKEDINDPDFFKISEGEALPGGMNLGIEPFEFESSGRIVITGINYNATDLRPYCFTLYPYTLRADGTRDTETYKMAYPWVCKLPELVGPSKEQFSGVKEAASSGSQLQIIWPEAVAGIFGKYEIFIKRPNTPSIFNFPTAITQFENSLQDSMAINHYMRFTRDAGIDSMIVSGLPDGNYDVGVITYFAYQNTPVRSQLNEMIFRCSVDKNRTDNTGSPIPMNCIHLK